MSDDEMPDRNTPVSRPEEIGLDSERLEVVRVPGRKGAGC